MFPWREKGGKKRERKNGTVLQNSLSLGLGGPVFGTSFGPSLGLGLGPPRSTSINKKKITTS